MAERREILKPFQQNGLFDCIAGFLIPLPGTRETEHGFKLLKPYWKLQIPYYREFLFPCRHSQNVYNLVECCIGGVKDEAFIQTNGDIVSEQPGEDFSEIFDVLLEAG